MIYFGDDNFDINRRGDGEWDGINGYDIEDLPPEVRDEWRELEEGDDYDEDDEDDDW